MSTKKPLSTISYNTADGLRNALKEAGASFYIFIPHLPEPAHGALPAETKEHFHVYYELGGKKVDPATMQDYFIEYVSNEDKPRSCVDTRTVSSFDDWYLYALHDKDYLDYKGEWRYYHYKHSDLVSSDSELLAEKARCINLHKFRVHNYLARFQEAYNNGIRSFGSFLTFARPPIAQYQCYLRAWNDFVEYMRKCEGRTGDCKAISWDAFPALDVACSTDTITGEVIALPNAPW